MQRVHNIKKLYSRRKDLRNHSTEEEIILWSQLKNSKTGLKFRRQHSIGGYIADFYCPDKKLVVEIDGSSHLKKEAKEYDQIRSDFLEGLDVKILRFTNAEIRTNLKEVLKRIINE